MNTQPRESTAKPNTRETDEAAERTPTSRIEYWLVAIVLLANIVATVVVVIVLTSPSALRPANVGALYGYAFIGSLVTSVVGALTLAIRRKNPWWLLTILWAIALVMVILEIARALSMASMH